MLASAVISFFLSATGIGIIVTIWLEASLFLAFLHLIDNRKDENVFSAVFNAFYQGRALPIFLTGLLKEIFIWLWGLLLFIPGIIKSYSYAMAYYIADDLTRQGKKVGPTEAITKSCRLMDGHKWELFVLDLSFLGWAILSLLTLNIAYLWLVPYIQATRAEFYRNLVAQNPAALAD